jgi:hypothetical protein
VVLGKFLNLNIKIVSTAYYKLLSRILKKISTPSKEDLIKEIETIALEGRKRSEKLGIKESDVPELVKKFRKSKR